MRKQFLFKRFNCFINSANIRYFPWGQAKTVAFQSLVSFFYTANTRHWLSACSNVQFFSQLRQYSAFSTSSEGNFFSNVQLFRQLRQCSAFSVRQGQSGLICKCSAVSSTPTILPFFFIKKINSFINSISTRHWSLGQTKTVYLATRLGFGQNMSSS